MKEFWIVYKWDNYYPSGGIDNIALVTFGYKEAKDMQEAWSTSPKKGYMDTSTNLWIGSRTDNCEIYNSNELPWSDRHE